MLKVVEEARARAYATKRIDFDRYPPHFAGLFGRDVEEELGRISWWTTISAVVYGLREASWRLNRAWSAAELHGQAGNEEEVELAMQEVREMFVFMEKLTSDGTWLLDY